MTNTEIIDYVKNHGAGKVKIAVVDIDGVLRGKYISTEKFLQVIDSSFGFCDVVFGWDIQDVAYSNCAYTGWHSGYPDALAKIDVSTFRKIPWENNLPFFLGEFINQNKEALSICPRGVFKKVIQTAQEMGFSPVMAQEFEWFNFIETPKSLADKNFSNLTPLTPGMFGYSVLRASSNAAFMDALFAQLKDFDVPIEGLHTETGPGVYEAAILYGEALVAADRAVLFKTATKEIAYKHGIMPTFMAKVSENLPGCSGHVHQSLWDSTGSKNLFYEEGKENKMSDLMKQYIAGQLHCLPFILPLIAPTINSYKRLVEGAWAPTTVTWGIDNRTVALRALPGGSKSARLETRVVGSDTNPYLALAACLAAGLYGIQNKLELKQPATIGNGYLDESNGRLPKNLWEATQAMKNSNIPAALFGADFVAHFVGTREWEWKQFSRVVTDWETKRYLELV